MAIRIQYGGPLLLPETAASASAAALGTSEASAASDKLDDFDKFDPGPKGPRLLKRAIRGVGRAGVAVARALVPRVALELNDEGQATHLRVTPRASKVLDPDRGTSASQRWVIEPSGSGLIARLRELSHYRGILKFTAGRSLRKMTTRSTFGRFWLFARPLMPILISTAVFGRILNIPSDGVPYFLFFLTGTMVWMLFERSVLWVTRSLDQNKGLIRKVYFPRLIVPIASVAPSVSDAFVYTSVFIVTVVYYLVSEGRWYLRFDLGLLIAPFVMLMSIVYAISIGLWTTVWQTRFREVRYTLRYFMRFWHYLTPVLYPMSQVPPEYRWILYLNPMAPLVETFKWSLLGLGEVPLTALASALVVIGLTAFSGLWYFTRYETASVDRM